MSPELLNEKGIFKGDQSAGETNNAVNRTKEKEEKKKLVLEKLYLRNIDSTFSVTTRKCVIIWKKMLQQ